MASGITVSELDDVPPLCDNSDDEDAGWDDVEEEEMSLLEGDVCSLFCSHHEGSVDALLKHCIATHKFNLVETCRKYGIDCIEYIKLINFIRGKHPSPSEVIQGFQSGGSPWADDRFMQAVDASDLMLQFDIESAMASMDFQSTVDSGSEAITALTSRLRSSEEEQEVLREELARAMAEIERLRLSGQQLVMRMSGDDTPLDKKKGKTREEKENKKPDMNGDALLHEEDGYFASYTHHGIHATMLQDAVRTDSYRDFMLKNPHLFEGKNVLDVGCGTGILSMFAVKAGAKHVVAVDQSNIIYQAMDIARQNELQDKITFVKGRLEDVTLPIEKFDVIISEWMGYFLFYEAMLDSVIWARDHYLAPGGCVYPDHFSVHLVGVDDPDLFQSKVDFWDDVYGYKMSCMKTSVVQEVCVRTVRGDRLITEPALIKDLDVTTCKVSDLEFASDFSLKCIKDGQISSLAGYFITDFDKFCQNKISFSTGPEATRTHWDQAIMFLPQPLTVTAGSSVSGHITYRKHPHDERGILVSLRLGQLSYKYHLS